MFVAIHCHEPLVGASPNPSIAESILRLRVQRTLFSAFKNLENHLIQKRVG